MTTNHATSSSSSFKYDQMSIPLLISVRQYGHDFHPRFHTLWYKIDVGKDESEVPIIDESDFETMPPEDAFAKHCFRSSDVNCYFASASAMFNSHLFMFGGEVDCCRRQDNPSTKDILVLNTDLALKDTEHTTNGSGWSKHRHELKIGRHEPVTVTIGNRIFIFGLVRLDANGCVDVCDPHVEVFNAKTKKVEYPISQPEFIVMPQLGGMKSRLVHFIKRSPHSAAVVNYYDRDKRVMETKILYCVGLRLLYYYIHDNRWEDITKSHPNFYTLNRFPKLSKRSVVKDGVFYTYIMGEVYAYDLEDKKWFNQALVGLLGKNPRHIKWDSLHGFIVDVGNGQLCVGFCTFFPDIFPHPKAMLFHYARFTPHIEGRGGPQTTANKSITVKVHSKGYRLIRGKGFVDAEPVISN